MYAIGMSLELRNHNRKCLRYTFLLAEELGLHHYLQWSLYLQQRNVSLRIRPKQVAKLDRLSIAGRP